MPEKLAHYRLSPEAPGTEPAGYDSHAPASPASPGAVAGAAVSPERLAELRYFLTLPSGCWHSPEFAEQAIQELLCAHDNLHAQWDEQWAYANDFREMFEASRKDDAALTTCIANTMAAAPEATRELSYERQMRQQTEEAMIKLAARVKEAQQEAADAEAEKLALQEELRGLRDAVGDAREMAYTNFAKAWRHVEAAAFPATECDNEPALPIAAPAAPEAGPVGDVGDGESQFPGMPEAKCHGCGLPSHVARCQSADCPMKGGIGHE